MGAENDVSLLFKLETDASGVDTGARHAAATVARLRGQFGNEAQQFQTAGIQAIQGISNHLTNFVSQRLPLLGKGFSVVTQGLASLGPGATATAAKLRAVETSIADIAKVSGKTKEEVSHFLSTFVSVEGQAARNKLSFDFFGQSSQQLNPKLQETSANLKALNTEATGAAAGIQSMVTPSAVALIGITALATAAVATITTLIHLGKEATEYGDSIHQAHLKTRISIENLGALRIAAHGVGQDLGSLSIAFLRLQKNIEAADKGNEKIAKTLQKEGITSFKSADAALVEFFDHFSELATEEEKIASVSAVFGQRFGARLIGTFDQVRGSLTEFKNELRANGQLLSEDQVRAAAAADDANDKLRETYDALGRQVGISVVPILAKLTDVLADNLKAAIALAGGLALVGTVLLTLRFPAAITFITSFGTSVRILGQAMLAAIPQILGFAAAENVATVSTLALSAAFTGLLIVAVAAAIIIWSQYSSAVDEANAVTKEAVEEFRKAGEASEALEEKLNAVKDAQSGSVEQHERLNDVLKALDPQTRVYVESVEDLEERIRLATEAVKEHTDAQAQEALVQAQIVAVGVVEQYEQEQNLIKETTRLRRELARAARGEGVSVEFTSLQDLAETAAKAEADLKKLRDEIPKNEQKLRLLSIAARQGHQSFVEMVSGITQNEDAVKRLREAYVTFTPVLDTSAAKLKEQAEAWERLRKALHGSVDTQTLLNELTKAGVDLSGEQAEANEKFIDEYKTGLSATQRLSRENLAKAEADFKQGLINNQTYARQRIENERIVSVAEEQALRHRIDLKTRELQELAKKAQVKPEKAEQEALARGVQDAEDLNEQLLDLLSNRKIKERAIQQEADEAEKKLRQDHKAALLQIEDATNRAFLEKQKELAKTGGIKLDIAEGLDAVSPEFVKKATGALERALKRILTDPEIQEAVKEASKQSGLPETLLNAIIAVESGGNRLARSEVGATGLMQIMEANFKALGIASRKEAENAATNIKAGAKLFAYELERSNGDVRQALVAWNSTIKNFTTDRDAGKLPQVIQEFIAKVQIANNLLPTSAKEAAAAQARVTIEALEAERDLLIERLANLGKYAAERVQLEKDIALKTIQINQARAAEDRRRTEEEKAEFARRTAALLVTGQTNLRVAQIEDQQRIESLRAAATQRIRTEEGVERDILAIRLAANDREATLLRARQLVAKKTIEDPEERKRALNDLNNQLRILGKEREAIERSGDRAVEEARQKDLANLEAYAQRTREIEAEIVDTERELQQMAIAFLIATHADRRTILKAQTDLEIAEENRKFTANVEAIRKEQSAITLRIKTLDRIIKKLEDEGKAETEEALTAIRARAAANGVLSELDKKAERELERHLEKMRRIRRQETQDEKDPANKRGKFGLPTKEDLENDAKTMEESVVTVNDILVGSFNQVADAIGSVVEQYVLYGETGPAVMRKILAAALATIAKEAAVNAVKMLAVGFMMLALGNFAAAGEAFVSAGYWAVLAGGAAIAGRAIAGDAFKQPASSGSSRDNSNSAGVGGSSTPRPIDLLRSQQESTLRIIVHAEPGTGFNNAVVQGIIRDVQLNGQMRNVIIETASNGA